MSETIGRYRLERRLATGGMAEVYLARQVGPDGFERQCVLKRMLPELTVDASLVQMFLDEAKLVALLSHPNIAQIFDFGRTDTAYFLAMEYVPGITLRALIQDFRQRGARLSEALACRIIADAALGLHFAHEACDLHGAPLGIIHRDISPANILLSQSGAVKLIDFGVAKARSASQRTASGVVKGKFAYMSPEQILGQPLDRRADLFALALVLYELLTNTRAYEAENEAGVVRRAVERQLVPAQTLRAELSDALAQVLEIALAAKPAERYADAAAFAAALEAHLMSQAQQVPASALGALAQGVRAREASVEARTPSMPLAYPPADSALPEGEVLEDSSSSASAAAPGDAVPTRSLDPRLVRPAAEGQGLLEAAAAMPPAQGAALAGNGALPQSAALDVGARSAAAAFAGEGAVAPGAALEAGARSAAAAFSGNGALAPGAALEAGARSVGAAFAGNGAAAPGAALEAVGARSAAAAFSGNAALPPGAAIDAAAAPSASALRAGAALAPNGQLPTGAATLPAGAEVRPRGAARWLVALAAAGILAVGLRWGLASPSPAADVPPPSAREVSGERPVLPPSVAAPPPSSTPPAAALPPSVAALPPSSVPSAAALPPSVAAPPPVAARPLEAGPPVVPAPQSARPTPRLAKDGRGKGRVVPGTPVEVAAAQPAPPAAPRRSALQLEAVPPARVLVGGQPRGTTPLSLELAPGLYELEFVNDALRRSERRKVTLVEGESRREEWRLGAGTVSFRVLPYGEVFEGGKSLGVTPLPPQERTEGLHTFRIVHPETQRSETRQIEVLAGKMVQVKVDLSGAAP